VRPPVADIKYHAFADPSGGTNDSFTMAISHREPDDRVVLDLLFEKRALLNPYEVAEEIAKLLKEYRCSTVVGDNYAAKWVEAQLQSKAK